MSMHITKMIHLLYRRILCANPKDVYMFKKNGEKYPSLFSPCTDFLSRKRKTFHTL